MTKMEYSNQFPRKKPKRTGTWKLIDAQGNIHQNTYGQYAICMMKKMQIPLAFRKKYRIVPF